LFPGKTFSNAALENSIDCRSNYRWLNSPIAMSMNEEIRKAAYTIRNFMYTGGVIHDKQIPMELLRIARGLAFLTVVKAGFLLTGKVGTGLVVARLPDGSWSAPSAIATAGTRSCHSIACHKRHFLLCKVSGSVPRWAVN
jgi:lipid-binding SYLF domain-containing protein